MAKNYFFKSFYLLLSVPLQQEYATSVSREISDGVMLIVALTHH